MKPRRGSNETERSGKPSSLERDPVITELRKLYDGIASEPVPDHLLELLRKLDEVERSR